MKIFKKSCTNFKRKFVHFPDRIIIFIAITILKYKLILLFIEKKFFIPNIYHRLFQDQNIN